MTLRNYLIFMLAATLVCWVAFTYVVYTINPNATNWLGFTLFYASLFLSLIGTSAIIGFLIRFIVLRQALVFRSVSEAFRQSFLFALLIIIALWLLARDLFTWFNILFLIIGLTLLEYFLVARGRSRILKKRDIKEEGNNI